MNPEVEIEKLYDEWEQFQACGFWNRVIEASVIYEGALTWKCTYAPEVAKLQGEIRGLQYSRNLPERLFIDLKAYYEQEKKIIEQRRELERRDSDSRTTDRAGEPAGFERTPAGDDD